MKIEHVALIVADPAGMARWWERNLGMKIVRSSDKPPFGHFVADSSGQILLELHHPSDVPVPDYASMDARILHLAFVADDMTATRDRLLKAGATLVTDVETIPSGDRILMLRDPWGLAIQFVRRSAPML